VTNMSEMFYACSGDAFNPDVSNWDVSKVTSMYYVFYNCSGAAFNPDVSAWNVSKVTSMYYMFYKCSGAAFNPDVSAWNVSKVTSMYYMFYKCSGAAFRGGRGVDGIGIANWRLKTGDNAVNMSDFMLSSKTQDPPFLDDILNAWEDLHAQGLLPTNITVHFGSNKYTAAGNTAYTTLTDDAGWTIASGGLQA
jgi:surface protein